MSKLDDILIAFDVLPYSQGEMVDEGADAKQQIKELILGVYRESVEVFNAQGKSFKTPLGVIVKKKVESL